MLAAINYRGKHPTTVEDWRFVFESIRRSVKRRASQELKHASTRRTWNTLEALWLTKATGIDDPVEAMLSRAQLLVERGELVGPPTNLPLLASIQGVVGVEP